MKKIAYTNNQSGQVAIVILLIMVVLLTVGLSLASRTTQDLFLSQQESESARVFNAAEVGVEDALSQDFDAISGTVELNPTTVSDVTTSTTIQPNSSLETQIVEGAAVHVNLQGYGGSTFTIDWAKETSCGSAASLLVSIYYLDGTTTEVIHDAIAPGNCRTDEFAISNASPSDGAYYRTVAISLPGGTTTPLFARVRSVYNDTAIRITGGVGFPTQFFIIRSEANTDIGEESRTVEVGRTLSGAPSFMDYALYSGADITVESVP